MEIKTCNFVDASDVFEGCPDAWQAFMDSDPPVSWGDANRTMTTSILIQDTLGDWFSDDEDVESQIQIVVNRLQGVDCYIDLEN
jgi:hypothetical protein